MEEQTTITFPDGAVYTRINPTTITIKRPGEPLQTFPFDTVQQCQFNWICALQH